MAGNSFTIMPFAGNTQLIPQHTRQQFQDAFNAQLQQSESRFAAVTNVDSAWTAQQYTKRQRGPVEWLVNNQRFGKRPAVEFAAGFRTGFANNLEMVPVKFDRTDKKRLDTIALPTGDVIQDAMSGLNRLRDQLFISAAVDQSYGGDFPHVTPTAFPSGNVIPVNYVKPGTSPGSNSGLTIWKVLRAKRLLRDTGIDLDREELVLAVGYDQPQQLILSAEAATNEAWAKATLDWFMKFEAGDTSAKLFGFSVIVSQYVTAASSIRNCVAFAKRAMCWKPMGSVETKIEEGSIEDRSQIVVGGYADMGVFREYDELVFKVPCAE